VPGLGAGDVVLRLVVLPAVVALGEVFLRGAAILVVVLGGGLRRLGCGRGRRLGRGGGRLGRRRGGRIVAGRHALLGELLVGQVAGLVLGFHRVPLIGALLHRVLSVHRSGKRADRQHRNRGECGESERFGGEGHLNLRGGFGPCVGPNAC